MLSGPRLVPGIAVRPPAPHSVHLAGIELPELGPKDVLVRVAQVGFCGTDREIIQGHLGAPPAGTDALVIGHEVLGAVEAVGERAASLKIGDLVTATVRRGCDCPQCVAGEPDFCSRFGYRERGILGLHGFLTERFVEHEDNLVRIPAHLAHLGVLTEPLSVAEKAWRVAQAVQTRMQSWRPQTAFVFGAGPIGTLATLVLRARGIAVYTLDLKPEPNQAAALTTDAGAIYVCTEGVSTADLTRDLPSPDLIIECTGNSAVVVLSMELLGANGVLV